jgi:hypothetical protein
MTYSLFRNMNNFLDKNTKNNTFSKEAALPEAWAIKARYLKYTADRIDWTSNEGMSRLVWVNYMLMGMAIESLLKGHMLFRGIEPVDKKKGGIIQVNKVFKSHDLHVLAEKIACPALPISREELELLEKLSEFVKWVGRYPVPLNAYKIGTKQVSSIEYKKIQELYSRLHEPFLVKDPGKDSIICVRSVRSNK